MDFGGFWGYWGGQEGQNGRCIIMRSVQFMGHRWEMQYDGSWEAVGASGKRQSGVIRNRGI